MMLVEETQVSEAALPVAELKKHLRLGTGFEEDDVQDAVLGSFLRAAMAAVEARTSKILLRRGFILTLKDWPMPDGVAFPVAPVTAVARVSIIDSFGTPQDVLASRYHLQQDTDRPKLRGHGGHMPRIPSEGSVEIRFMAGFSDTFSGLPADLTQAVLLLAAHYYEYRDATSLSQGCMPFGVTSLLARYRAVRLGTSV